MSSFKFEVPSSIMIVGPSSCGKTVFVQQLIKYLPQMFTEKIKTVKYCYGVWQDRYKQMKGVEFHKGIPEVSLDHKSFFPPNQRPGLLILDDVMGQAGDSQTVVDLFTKDSHHKRTKCLLLLKKK